MQKRIKNWKKSQAWKETILQPALACVDSCVVWEESVDGFSCPGRVPRGNTAFPRGALGETGC